MKRVAIVGTSGVPAHYGGFETMVENIVGDNCSSEVQYTIFCSSCGVAERLKSYKGCRLKYVPLRANGIQSVPYDIVSMMCTIGRYDAVLVLGVSGGLFLPVLKLLSRARIVVNIDGLEHRRDKWGRVARWFLRLSERVAVHSANVVVADNQGIKDYVWETYHKETALIAYGGDHAVRDVPASKQADILAQYDLTTGDYAISICRIEPENNCHIILEAFTKASRRLVFVGNWQHSPYARQLRERYGDVANITLVDACYDLDILCTLRANAQWYIHGHSSGGTNPSLIEAMFFGISILAYDVIYNRATTNNEACYFANSEELLALLSCCRSNGEVLRLYAAENYRWGQIARQYEALYFIKQQPPAESANHSNSIYGD